MTILPQLKKLKDPERTAIVYDLYRIFMNAEDSYLRLDYSDGATGAAKEKLDQILASIHFEQNWDRPGYARVVLDQLGKFSDWERNQNKPKDPAYIQRLLEDLFTPKSAVSGYLETNHRNWALAETSTSFSAKK